METTYIRFILTFPYPSFHMLRTGEDARGGRVTSAQPPSPAAHSQSVKGQESKKLGMKNNVSEGAATGSYGASGSTRDSEVNGDEDNSEEVEDENEELSDDEDEGTDGYKKGSTSVKNELFLRLHEFCFWAIAKWQAEC